MLIYIKTQSYSFLISVHLLHTSDHNYEKHFLPSNKQQPKNMYKTDLPHYQYEFRDVLLPGCT